MNGELLDLLATHFVVIEGLPGAGEWRPVGPDLWARIEVIDEGSAWTVCIGHTPPSWEDWPVLFAVAPHLVKPDCWRALAVTRRRVRGATRYTLHRRLYRRNDLNFGSVADAQALAIPHPSSLTTPLTTRAGRYVPLCWVPPLVPPPPSKRRTAGGRQ